MINLLIAGLLFSSTPESTDSLRATDIEEVVVVATPKETSRLRQQPLSSTSFAQEQMRESGISGIKSLSANVPNLFIPDYGSHLTTSIYIRGIGARMGTPAVSLYVDGVPQVSAASFDFNFSDVDRIDVLRGPQSTLYGRNSMGGVVRVFTKNPFQYQGTDLTVDGSIIPNGYPNGSPNGGWGKGRFTLTHYHRVSNQFAWSINLFGLKNSGYFRNGGRNDELIDSETDLGGRLRFIFKPTATLSFDLTANHEWLNQGGYPYEYQGTVGNPTTPEPTTAIGQIAYNSRSGYRRSLTNVGFTVDKKWSNATLTSVTGFQHLHDRMDLDQDFTNTNLYTLIQRQNANTLSEEVILKGGIASKMSNSTSSNFRYTWLFGVSALQQWNSTDGPVAFHNDGLEWLNGLINNMANSHMPVVKSPEYSMKFAFNNQILGSDLGFPGTYDTPNTNFALFHQSTMDNLFGVKGLTLAAGIRLDYESNSLDYDARYSFNQSYGLNGNLTYPDGHTRDNMVLVPVDYYYIEDAMHGHCHKDYLEVMPKVSIAWKPIRNSSAFTINSIYATVSRGYRSGGYNIQMFSDLLQSRMQTRIMQNVTDATLPVVYAQPAMPDVAKATVETILTSMATEQPIDVQASTWYKPETSWNYELGTHLNLLNNHLQTDISAFWMDTRDQQVTQMSSGGLGRVTTNSGKSRSIGAEVSVRAFLTDDLETQASYGYTHAKFCNADETFIPFIPSHTLSVGATQHWHLNSASWVDGVSLHADYRGAGRIYWTEGNNAWQDFAGTVNARLTVHHKPQTAQANGSGKSLDISLYAHNLLGTRYQTFYFVTMQRGFAQYTRPATLGVELRYCF